MQSDICSSSQKCLQILLTTVGFKPSSLLAVLVFCYVWLVIPIPLNHYHHPPLIGMQTVFPTLISMPWENDTSGNSRLGTTPRHLQAAAPPLLVSGALYSVRALVCPSPSCLRRRKKSKNFEITFTESVLLTGCQCVVDKNLTKWKQTQNDIIP